MLKINFEVEVFELSPDDFVTTSTKNLSTTLTYKCVAIDSGKVEKIRDSIKKVIWFSREPIATKYSLQDVFGRNKTEDINTVRVSDYGLFVPYRQSKWDDIRTHTFSHKPFYYRYRTAQQKKNHLPQNLSEYLDLLYTDCPNHLFQQSNLRSSGQTCCQYRIDIHLNHTRKHELLEFANASLSFEQFKSRHENLQKFLLLEDPCTVASEVPLWLEPHEIKNYAELFQADDVLTGHVDILRLEKDGRIGVWDYKPGALNEQKAMIQVFLYAFMLSIRTGICLKDIICGYFDESDIFYFEPCQVKTFNGQFRT